LRAPATDIMAGEVSWTVLLPETRRLYDAKGDLKPYATQVVPTLDLKRPTTSVARRQTVHRLREGVERFLITDINNPAGAVRGGPTQRYQGPPLTPEQAGAGSSVSAVAGVLPVPIDLPRTGVPYRFHTVLTAQGKALDLHVTTYPRWIAAAFGVLTTIGMFAAGMAVAWAFLSTIRRTARKLRGAHVSLAFALAGVVALGLLKHYAALSLAPAIYGALLAVALLIAPTIIRLAGSVRSIRSAGDSALPERSES
jgi:hypothetical protein